MHHRHADRRGPPALRRTARERGARAWLAAFALLAAACGTSDADRIDDFVKAVTGEVTTERIDRALASYVDLSLEPLTVSIFGDPRAYDPEQGAKLAHDAHARLSFLSGKRLNVLSRHIAIKPPMARVELQLLGREGMGHVRYELAKHGERWLIAKVDVGR